MSQTPLSGCCTELAGEVGAAATERVHCAVTMTAELSQMFRTKREGVALCSTLSRPRSRTRIFACSRPRTLSVGRRSGSRSRSPWPRRTGLPRPGSSPQRYRTVLLIDVGTTNDRHYSDRRRGGRSRGQDGSRSARFGRAGVHGRAAHAGGSDCSRRAVSGRPAERVCRVVRAGRRRAPVARSPGAGRLHRADA